HLVLHLFIIGGRDAFGLLPVGQLLQTALGVAARLASGGGIFNRAAFQKNNDGQGAHVVRLDLQDAVGELLHLLLVTRLLVGAHGLLERVNLDNAVRVLGDEGFHGLSFGRGIRGVERRDVGVVLSRIFDHLLAGGNVSLLTGRRLSGRLGRRLLRRRSSLRQGCGG